MPEIGTALLIIGYGLFTFMIGWFIGRHSKRTEPTQFEQLYDYIEKKFFKKKELKETPYEKLSKEVKIESEKTKLQKYGG